jgi:hypothetical protein
LKRKISNLKENHGSKKKITEAKRKIQMLNKAKRKNSKRKEKIVSEKKRNSLCEIFTKTSKTEAKRILFHFVSLSSGKKIEAKPVHPICG